MVENVLSFFSALLEIGAQVSYSILNFLWDFFMIIIHFLFDWINIPAFPKELEISIDTFLDLIFNNLGLLGFFVRPFTLKLIIPLLLVAFNFKNIYKLLMWILKKIPFLSMK